MFRKMTKKDEAGRGEMEITFELDQEIKDFLRIFPETIPANSVIDHEWRDGKLYLRHRLDEAKANEKPAAPGYQEVPSVGTLESYPLNKLVTLAQSLELPYKPPADTKAVLAARVHEAIKKRNAELEAAAKKK